MKKQLAALFCTGVMTISLFAGAAFAEDTGSVEGIQASRMRGRDRGDGEGSS